MDLKLYDTLTREKRVFTPLDPARVRMYVCGPTVYDFAHIGNARPVIVFDVLFRLLRHLYGESHVTYVRNVTDVDDKINARAAERGISIRDLTETTYQNFKADVAALGCLEPTVEPRATEHIDEMKALIEKLVASKHAYVAEEHVLFDVPSMPDYGQLSKRPLDEMIAGARVEVAPYKRNPTDFVLWKPSPPDLPGWDSPWGRGRPGWHIECSAMAWKHLGETFDIHGGGIDLVFPHHENEIAQSRCAFHTGVMANYWMHNGFLQVEGEKMAKSAGNFVTIRELLSGWKGTKWSGAVVRLALLMTQYRQPLDFGVARLQEAKAVLDGWAIAATDTSWANLFKTDGSIDLTYVRPSNEILIALCDDLNTHEAIAAVTRLAKASKSSSDASERLAHTLAFLGFAEYAAIDRPHGTLDELSDIADGSKIEQLIQERLIARKAKNFKEADRIRDELAAMGVVLKDSKDGTTWEIAR